MNCAKRSVLLVDDSVTIRKSLRTLVDAAGFICSEATNGAEALEEAGKLKPDLIVLDYSMPVMNGLEGAPLLKKILPDTPILMFTLFENPSLEKLALAAGVRAICPKDEAGRLLGKAESILNSPNS